MSSSLRLLVEKYGIPKVAKRLGYSYSYIHKVASGEAPATQKLRRRIDRTYRKHARTVTIRYSEDEEPMRQRHLALTMDERKKRLEGK